jgi:ABC-type Fe3+/spermidine/putrescine transport system ATPase subunit
MMNFLEVTKVFKKYPGRKVDAVNGVSFNIAKGEIFSLIGESGCGKTTLLKLINGLEDSDQGKIILNGLEVTGPSKNLVPGHPMVQMLFQSFNLFPKHTVIDNILYTLRYFDEAYQHKRSKELLKLCKLEKIENDLPSELSGGQQQRVALARALANKPALLLMDEPFSNLDIILKAEIKNDIVDIIKSTGTTLLFVTHDVNDALAISDRIAVMKDGHLLQIDTPRLIYEKPKSPYVGQFFGASNILTFENLSKIVSLNLPREQAKKVKPGSKASIRAENIKICSEEGSNSKGKVSRVSYYGSFTEVEVKVADKIILLVHTKKKKITAGEVVFLKLNLKKIHFFDSGNE